VPLGVSVVIMDEDFAKDAYDALSELVGIGGRPRAYLRSGRTSRLNARFSEAERAEIEVGAAAIGMTTRAPLRRRR